MAQSKMKPQLKAYIREAITERLAALNEGTIDNTVINPMLSAMRNKDTAQVGKIYKMSLSQFSPQEISGAIKARIAAEQNAQQQVVLKAMNAQYAKAQQRPAAQQAAVNSGEGQMAMNRQQAAVAGGGGPQVQRPAAAQGQRQMVAESKSVAKQKAIKESLKALIDAYITEALSEGPAYGNIPVNPAYAGKSGEDLQDIRFQKAKLAKMAQLKKQNAAKPAQDVTDDQIVGVETDYAGQVKKAGQSVPPQVPAHARKKMVAEKLMKNIVKVLVSEELKRQRG